MDELISRQDLSNEIQRIYEEHYANANSQTVHDIFHAVLRRIDKAKVVDAESVRHGHWIETIEDGKIKRVTSCCGDNQTKLTTWYKPDYCPNCGATMDEVSE